MESLVSLSNAAVLSLSFLYTVTVGVPGKPNHEAMSRVQLSLVFADTMFVGILIRHNAAKLSLKYAIMSSCMLCKIYLVNYFLL